MEPKDSSLCLLDPAITNGTSIEKKMYVYIFRNILVESQWFVFDNSYSSLFILAFILFVVIVCVWNV